MLRPHGRVLCVLSRTFSNKLQRPQAKRVTHFDKQRVEIYMQDILDRASPLLELNEEKAQRGPFMKQIFQNKFDERFLTYPEVIVHERINDINAMHKKVKKYIDSLPADTMNNGVPPEVMKQLHSLGVFKILQPYSEEGLELSMTELARVMEAFANHPSLAAVIATHQIAGIQTLLRHAPPAQKEKHLPRLFAGEPIAALAIDEDTFTSTKTTVTLDSVDFCSLNGKKIFVKNGERAEVFVVICEVENEGEAVLLVDRNLPGVVVESSPETVGLKGSGLSTVFFNDVKVPFDCLLGDRDNRSKVARNLAVNVRCALSAAAVGSVRDAFDIAFKRTFVTERFQQLMCTFELIRKQLCLMAIGVHAMESCLYTSLAIQDVVEDPDAELESIATALISLNNSKEIFQTSGNIFGASGKYLTHYSTRWSNDIVDSPFFFSSPREHAHSLAKMGIRSVAQKLSTEVKKPTLQSTLTNQLDLKKKLMGPDTPFNEGDLYQFLHPSLIESANTLDYINRRFGPLCGRLVEKYGEEETLRNEIIAHHVSELAIDIFAVSQVLSRASRAYCIGLFDSYEEIKLATLLTMQVLPKAETILTLLDTIVESELPKENVVAQALFQMKDYSFIHPIVRPKTEV